MDRAGIRSVAPAVVAQRLCDLLLSFPAAASGGVQWQTLARSFEKRHGMRLDLAALGHSSALAAATALLWDVLRLVDGSDTDNPVVAVEEAVVMTPRPGLLACWPSLYKKLDEIVAGAGGELLLSQLKPLLQLHWHANFDESGLSYLTDEGNCVRLKKMKHLVTAVLRWRDQHIAWHEASGLDSTDMNMVLAPRLDLSASKRHNDLMLSYVHGNIEALPAPISSPPQEAPLQQAQVALANPAPSAPALDSTADEQELPSSARFTTELEQELALLRAQNAQLRCQNQLMLQHDLFSTPVQQTEPWVPKEEELFDNPFEPPPQMWTSPWASTTCSTGAPSDYGVHSGSVTPASSAELSILDRSMSGDLTFIGEPEQSSSHRNSYLKAAACAYMPNMPILFSPYMVIPSGIVQSIRAQFEPANWAAPGM